jgi:hypothetical protein
LIVRGNCLSNLVTENDVGDLLKDAKLKGLASRYEKLSNGSALDVHVVWPVGEKHFPNDTSDSAMISTDRIQSIQGSLNGYMDDRKSGKLESSAPETLRTIKKASGAERSVMDILLNECADMLAKRGRDGQQCGLRGERCQ